MKKLFLIASLLLTLLLFAGCNSSSGVEEHTSAPKNTEVVQESKMPDVVVTVPQSSGAADTYYTIPEDMRAEQIAPVKQAWEQFEANGIDEEIIDEADYFFDKDATLTINEKELAFIRFVNNDYTPAEDDELHFMLKVVITGNSNGVEKTEEFRMKYSLQELSESVMMGATPEDFYMSWFFRGALETEEEYLNSTTINDDVQYYIVTDLFYAES